MTRALAALLFIFLTPPLFAQQEEIQGDWKNKSNKKDTIVLTPGIFTHNELDAYIEKKEQNKPYVDTTFYWKFLKKDSLRIEFAIRSFGEANNQDSSQALKVDSSKIETETKTYESLNINLNS